MTESGIFKTAVKLPPNERGAYLDQACGANEALRLEMEGLLGAHDQAGEFMQRPPIADATTTIGPGPERPGMRIGPYKLLQFLGEGGMGTVFLAEQTEPVRRMVALKIIKPGMDSSQVLARFEAERQALALMDHPNIARVLDAGTVGSEQWAVGRTEGLSSLPTAHCPLPTAARPYFVMELVKGIPITEFCDQNKLNTRQRLELFIPVCQAIQHAHMKGIIHRDVKPSNVLIALYDGKPVPKVIDFGVAKAMAEPLTQRTLFTQVGQIVGTFEYMSPEQATLNQLDIDSRSDIYSLGVLLYELLTGCTPLDKERLRSLALDQMLRTIREEEPMRPSVRLSSGSGTLALAAAYRGSDSHKLAGQLRGELDWIAMKALDKDRSRRYDTASALAADVRRYLSEEPVEARAPSAWYRFRKMVRRNRAAVTAAALVASALIAGTAVALLFALEARHSAAMARDEKDQADQARSKAEDNENKAEWRLYSGQIASAFRETHNPPLLYRYLDQCRRDFRGWEHDYLYTLADQKQVTLLGHTGWVRCVAFSPDGKLLASAAMYDPTPPDRKISDRDQTVKLWDVTSGREVKTLKGHRGSIISVAFSPDGKYLASGGNTDQTVKVWEVATGNEVRTLEHQGNVDAVAYSPDGKLLASAGGQVKLWDVTTGREVTSLKGHGGFDLAFSPDGKCLAIAGWAEKTVTVWAVATKDEVRTLEHTGKVRCVAYSPDGKLLASTSWDAAIRLFDAASGRELVNLKDPSSGYIHIAFSPDSRLLAIGTSSNRGDVRLLDVATGLEVFTVRRQAGISTVAFSPDGTRLATGGRDGAVVLSRSVNHEGLTLKGTGVCAAFSPDGGRLATVSNFEKGKPCDVKVWGVVSGKEVLTPIRHESQVHSVAFSPDGRRLATGASDGTAKLWDAISGQEIATLEGHLGNVNWVAFSPDGQYLASGSSDGSAKLWDVAAGKAVLTLKDHVGGVHCVAFSPDGKRLACASGKAGAGEVKLWDVASGQEVRALRGHASLVYSVAFDSDGQRLATASADGTSKVWEAASGEEIQTLKGHAASVFCVAFSPDGKRLATASMDRTVKVWDAGSGQEVLTLSDHSGAEAGVKTVIFSPDGKRLASASGYLTIVWDGSESMKEVGPK